MQEEVKRLAEKKESLTSARSPARDNYSTRSDEWVGKSNSSPCSLEQRIIELYAELVQGNIYVNLINKEMEKTRQELDQGNVTVQKLQKRWIHSPSRNNEPKPPLKQASKMSFLHPGSLCIVSETIVIFICHEWKRWWWRKQMSDPVDGRIEGRANTWRRSGRKESPVDGIRAVIECALPSSFPVDVELFESESEGRR